jgi:hypothetical protein
MDSVDYAQKATASDAPKYFPGMTPGQTAIAAGVMVALPAAAVAIPAIPGAAAALGVAYLSNPVAVNSFVTNLLSPTPSPPSPMTGADWSGTWTSIIVDHIFNR